MLTFTFVKYRLLKKVIIQMKEQGIFENHRDYIKAWLTYLDQKKFNKELEKQMLNEISKYLKTRSNIYLDYIVEIIWNATDTEAWIILIEKDLAG